MQTLLFAGLELEVKALHGAAPRREEIEHPWWKMFSSLNRRKPSQRAIRNDSGAAPPLPLRLDKGRDAHSHFRLIGCLFVKKALILIHMASVG